MTNYEAYNVEEVIKTRGLRLYGFDTEKRELALCSDTKCENCAFDKLGSSCHERSADWLKEEYVEPPVDWTKVAIDTKVQVCDDNISWGNRYFAKYSNGLVYTWAYGATSWSNASDPIAWNYARLAGD